MTPALRVLGLAMLLAVVPLARAEDDPPPGAPPVAPAPAAPTHAAPSPEQWAEVARLRAELAEAKAKIDTLRAERDAATIAGCEKKASDLTDAVSAMEKRIVDIKTRLHAFPGARPSGPGAEDARVSARHAELIAALRRASEEANDAEARGDDAAAVVALEKAKHLTARLAEAGKASSGRDSKLAEALLSIPLQHGRAAVKEAEARGDVAAADAARKELAELERKLAFFRETATRVAHLDEAIAAKRADLEKWSSQHVRTLSELERARQESAAARAKAEQLQASFEKMKPLVPLEGSNLGDGASILADLARAEALLEEGRRLVELTQREGGPGPHPPGPGEDAPHGPKSEALMRASRILREAGMPDRADQLQRDAANMAREEAQAREGDRFALRDGGGGGHGDRLGLRAGDGGGSGGHGDRADRRDGGGGREDRRPASIQEGGGGREDEIAELREEVRRLRELVERMAK